MDCKAGSNEMAISWSQRQQKVFSNVYFWSFWQSASGAFLTWHNINNDAVTITAIIHVLQDAVTKFIYLW